MIDKSKLYHSIDKLTDDDKKTVLDFVQFLIQRDQQNQNEVEKFYQTIPEIDEPYSEEETRQLNDNSGWVDWEALKRDISESSESPG